MPLSRVSPIGLLVHSRLQEPSSYAQTVFTSTCVPVDSKLHPAQAALDQNCFRLTDLNLHWLDLLNTWPQHPLPAVERREIQSRTKSTRPPPPPLASAFYRFWNHGGTFSSDLIARSQLPPAATLHHDGYHNNLQAGQFLRPAAPRLQ